MRRYFYLLPLALFLLLAVYFGVGLTKDPRLIPSALVDKPAPTFSLPALHKGAPGLSKSDLFGQVVVVNVFASWCVPCKVEHPLWMQLKKENVVPVFGIAWKDKRASAVNWLTQHGNPYKLIGFDPDNKVGVDWGVYGVPETYIIDRTGHIRYKHVGPLYPEIWKTNLLPIIQRLKAEKGVS
jgi:cytochrome c biogenesis protein CcmG/thiol:disulfide interchange protein DsbE